MDSTESSRVEATNDSAAAFVDTNPSPTGITLMKYAVLVAVGAFATTFAQSRVLANYPTLFLLKDHFHLKKEAVSIFFFWATFAWNLKPLAGILTDAFPLFGTRRRSYMILGSGLAGIFWLLMGMFDNAYMPLLLMAIGMNVATVFASTVMGGLMVEAGQAFGAPGRISSLRQVTQSVAGIGAPLLGGYLAGKAFGWKATTTIGAITIFSLAVLAFFLLRERPASQPASEDAANLVRPHFRVPIGITIGLVLGTALAIWLFLNPELKNLGISIFALIVMLLLVLGLTLMPTRNPVIIKAQGQLAQIFESRTLWLAVVMLFLVYTIPGFGTALTYRQSDVLKFDKSFIGFMGSLEGILGVIGAVGYGLICRKFNLRALLFIGISASAAATALYLVYTKGSAPYVHALGGFTGSLIELALMDLAVRSTPRGCEALGFSLMMSIRNFGLALSDVVGSKMIDDFHVPFTTLVLINAATTAVIMLFIPFLPRVILNRKEGEAKK